MAEKNVKNSPAALSAQEKIERLREKMEQAGVQGYLIPRADEFQGEFVPESSERLRWLTGFTGSAGMAAVLTGKAAVYSDGRYTLQLGKELDGGVYEGHTSSAARNDTLEDWIAGNAAAGDVIGYDPRLHTVNEIRSLKDKLAAKNISIKPVPQNLVDAVWDDRPAEPKGEVSIFPDSVAGMNIAQKKDKVASEIKDKNHHAAIISAPDSIAWLLNIRGEDVAHFPAPLSYAAIREDGHVTLFIDEDKLTPDVRNHFGNSVEIHPISDMKQHLAAISGEATAQQKSIQIDFNQSAAWFKTTIEKYGAKVVHEDDPVVALRAIKTQPEQEAIRQAHIRDGVALVKFLKWLEVEAPKGQLTEIDVEEKLLSFRKDTSAFHDTSFNTIAGWAENGAIVHYRAKPGSDARIQGEGLLLVDSGMQDKQGGTTDITRTIAVGNPTEDMIEDFTLVLKGHIGIAQQRFIEGTTGEQIDILARQALWQAGKNYNHGTGHGVGCFLHVHESGAGISTRFKKPLKPGMLISNEPGYYKENAYGIRIENLVLVQNDGKLDDGQTDLMRFETVSLAPIDRNLIDTSLLSVDELAWLNDYHEKVFQALSPHLNQDEKDWLREATAPLDAKPQRAITKQTTSPGSKPTP